MPKMCAIPQLLINLRSTVYAHFTPFRASQSYTRKAEMPASGDLKTGDSLFFTPSGISTDPAPTPRQIDPVPNGNDLGHYMKSYMKYILSKYSQARNYLCQ